MNVLLTVNHEFLTLSTCYKIKSCLTQSYKYLSRPILIDRRPNGPDSPIPPTLYTVTTNVFKHIMGNALFLEMKSNQEFKIFIKY